MNKKNLKSYKQEWKGKINEKIQEIISRNRLRENREEFHTLIYQAIDLSGDSSVTLNANLYKINVHKKFKKDGKTQVPSHSLHHVDVFDVITDGRIFTSHYNISEQFPDGIEF